jgi:hypothetical protein
VLFENGGTKRLATTLTSSSAKGSTFQAWYMEVGDNGEVHCLDSSKTRSEIRKVSRESIVAKLDGVTVDLATGEMRGQVTQANWAAIQELWDAYYNWVAEFMPEALESA